MTKSWIGRIAIALGILVLLLAAAAAVLIATFDANRYKTVAIDWMKTEHQRTLAIDGPIELSFFPRLAVKVSALRLSEAGRDDAFAAVEEAALAVRGVSLVQYSSPASRPCHALYRRLGARPTETIWHKSLPPAPARAAGTIEEDS